MPRKLFGKPLGEIFSFTTPVFINIKDERLGILHFALLLALVGYVILYQIFYEGAHLKTEAPLGSVSFQLKRPTELGDIEYWNASDADRTNTASEFGAAVDLKYCLNSTVLPKPPGQRNCRYLDEEDIVTLFSGVCVISTRVSTMVQRLVCNQAPSIYDNCTHIYQSVKSDSYYVVQPERFTFMIDHEVFTPTTGVYGKANDPGAVSKLTLPGGALISPVNDTGFQRLVNRDTMTVQQLLAAAGVDDLDTPTPGLFDNTSTKRNTGITILLKIKYSNYRPWGFWPSMVSYEYEASQGSVYEALHKTYFLDNVTRFFENRHGITINVAQIGKLSSFDVLALTMFLASTLALLTITNVVVDQIAVRLLREGKAYEKQKYMQTENRADIAEFLEHRKAQGLPEIQSYDEFREELRAFLESKEKSSTPLVGYN